MRLKISLDTSSQGGAEPPGCTQNRFLATFAGCFLPIGTIRISAAGRAIREESYLI